MNFNLTELILGLGVGAVLFNVVYSMIRDHRRMIREMKEHNELFQRIIRSVLVPTNITPPGQLETGEYQHGAPPLSHTHTYAFPGVAGVSGQAGVTGVTNINEEVTHHNPYERIMGEKPKPKKMRMIRYDPTESRN